MQVNILEAKSQLSQLIKSAQLGQDVVIANRGEPVARLVAVRALHARRAVAQAGDIVRWLQDNPLPAYLQRSAAEIDAAIQDERASWD